MDAIYDLMHSPHSPINQDEEEELVLYEDCPQCGKWWDEIDHEYQICSACGFEVNEED